MPKMIEINGTIIADDEQWLYDYFGVSACSPKKVKSQLKEANGDDVVVVVNSGGGDLWAGNEIAYALSTYAGNVTVDVTALAASAATVACCGGDKVRMAAGAQYMIHNVSSIAAGDYNDMDHMSDVLKNANKATSNVYRLKTGLSNDELLKLMNEETWMDADKALKYGFIDEIIGVSEQHKKADSFTLNNSAPKCVILTEEQKAEARAAKADEVSKEQAKQLMRNQLNLIKLMEV